MLGSILCLSLAAPVPEHLFPHPGDPLSPGFTWYYHGQEMQLVEIDGPVVTFRNLTRPGGFSTQNRNWTLYEAKRFGQPKYWRERYWFHHDPIIQREKEEP